MMNINQARPADQALAVPVEPVARLDPTGFDPSRKSVAGRLNPKFKIVFTGCAEESTLRLSGPLETKDELDAAVEALTLMRDWLADPAIATETRRAETENTDSVEDEGAGRKASPAPSQDHGA